jgi:hypothetical protein
MGARGEASVERHLTVAQVAALLGTSERFPRRLIARAAHPVRPGRTPRARSRVRASRVHRGRAGRTTRAIPVWAGGLMAHKRRFGRGATAAVRPVPGSLPGTRRHRPAAPQTFATKRAAEVWLTLKEGEIKRTGYLQHRRSRSRLSAGLVAGCAWGVPCGQCSDEFRPRQLSISESQPQSRRFDAMHTTGGDA